MKRPIIYFSSTGATGNIFAILGATRTELQRQRRITEYNEIRDRVMNSHSYVEALGIIREVVDLVDTDRRY